MDTHFDDSYKIIMIGDKDVGKTTWKNTLNGSL